MSMVARFVVALAAVLVLAWAGVLLRNLELRQDAHQRAFYTPKLSRAERDRNVERLTEAELLDPDSYWQVARASYYLYSGRPGTAAVVAEAVLRDEPENVSAWGILRGATLRSDPGRSARVGGEMRRLDPLGTRLTDASPGQVP